MPNLRWQLDDLFGENDRLCAQFTFTGCHQGPLLIGRRRCCYLPAGPSGSKASASMLPLRAEVADSRIWFDLAPFASAYPGVAHRRLRRSSVSTGTRAHDQSHAIRVPRVPIVVDRLKMPMDRMRHVQSDTAVLRGPPWGSRSWDVVGLSHPSRNLRP